jgi:D-3-phosphoglycerate dehydrogenase
MRILVAGDSFMPPRYFRAAFDDLATQHAIEYLQVDRSLMFEPMTDSERLVVEYEGSPVDLARSMSGIEVLVVHGAPVTDGVLDASEHLKLVACARGGPVNVDVAAITARGLPLVHTPGKNAEAVADQTLAFLVWIARGFRSAQRFLDEGNRLANNWEGARFIGSDLRGHTLGLIGYGQVGSRVALRALAFGMKVLVYDPLIIVSSSDGVQQAPTLDDLLAGADFVSLHARATRENAKMIDARALAAMKRGAYLVNTARETLVDEDALDAALASGRLAGAALDVVHSTERHGRHRLLRHDNVVLLPHVGGATHETLLQGAEMIAAEIDRFVKGDPLVHVFNRESITA